MTSRFDRARRMEPAARPRRAHRGFHLQMRSFPWFKDNLRSTQSLEQRPEFTVEGRNTAVRRWLDLDQRSAGMNAIKSLATVWEFDVVDWKRRSAIRFPSLLVLFLHQREF